MEVEGEELLKESKEYKVVNSFKEAYRATSYIGGGVSAGFGVARAATIMPNHLHQQHLLRHQLPLELGQQL